MGKEYQPEHDGVRIQRGNHDWYVVWRPDQIKSATENNGEYDPGNPDIRYSLAKRHQANPIFKDGEVRREYQDLLDHGTYTPENIRDWSDRALTWIERQGGVEEAVRALADGLGPADRHIGTVTRRLIADSKEFAALPADRRIVLERANIEAGTAWGREGAARRLEALKLDSHAKAQAFFDVMAARMKEKDFRILRNKVLDATGVDVAKLPDDITGDATKLDKVVREAYAADAGIFDKAYEWWINSILSAPRISKSRSMSICRNCGSAYSTM